EVRRAMGHDVEGASEIVPITNGVHVPTWQDHRVREAKGSPERLWEARQRLKAELLDVVATRSSVRLDPAVLTIGFARRAAAYKRSNLIFHDPARVQPLLEGRRVQLVVARQSHPDDATGLHFICALVNIHGRSPQRRAVYPHSDIGLSRALSRGAYVRLNNPIRPLEACGTSGMKAAMNGVLNCSILDGWWPEACEHVVNGWAIDDATSGVPEQDERDAAALYDVLEREVLPAYADRERWTAMIQASIAMAEERFSSDRLLREYFARRFACRPG